MQHTVGDSSRQCPGVDQPALPAWSLEKKIELRYIQPGLPMQIGYVESFYGRLREDCLRAGQLVQKPPLRTIGNCRPEKEYNEVRPHSSLDARTPNEFRGHVSNRAMTGPRTPTAFPVSP
jgi:putative transposase